jgi:hypothetical protein
MERPPQLVVHTKLDLTYEDIAQLIDTNNTSRF